MAFGKLTWLHGIRQDLINPFHRLVWRRVEDDNDRAEEAQRTAQFTQCSQPLIQEI
jgi:hypothetical protein